MTTTFFKCLDNTNIRENINYVYIQQKVDLKANDMFNVKVKFKVKRYIRRKSSFFLNYLITAWSTGMSPLFSHSLWILEYNLHVAVEKEN